MIENLGKLLSEYPGLAVSDYKGLSMKNISSLRDKIKPHGAKFMVVKNSLASLAAKGTPHEDFLADLKGPNAVVFIAEDASATLKTLYNLGKEYKETFKLRIGNIDGTVLDEAGLKAYSELPGREEVRSMFVGILQASMTQLVGVLAAPARTLTGVVNAYEQKLEKEQAA